jgi:hypothetical protein
MNRIIFFSLINIIILGKFSYARLIYKARIEGQSFQEMYMDVLEKALVKIEQEKFSDQDFETLIFFTNKMDEIKRQYIRSPVYWYSRQG